MSCIPRSLTCRPSLCHTRPPFTRRSMYIDNLFLLLASRNMTVREDANLAVGSTLHLRQVEKCHDQTKQPGATPDVATLSCQQLFAQGLKGEESYYWVEHISSQENARNLNDVVRNPSSHFYSSLCSIIHSKL
jgi:hypothetical protein